MERWLQIYREYSTPDLDAEIAWLKAQTRNLFTSQQASDRSYARSTAEVRDRLAATTQVKQECSDPDTDRHLTADFSGVRV